ncbi:lysophospholipid acyltransferase family protein [Aestuariimicrobium soli]|uniref:lysophospholipid acyltransferase family protein n=1 Tax=Aestuariimicrobium soli TaxID=2035834 RepID=UPI003EBDABFD
MWYWFLKWTLFRPVCIVAFRPWITGSENIPEGAAILAGNHLSAGDTFLLPALIRRRLTFPAKAELFKGDRGFRSKVVAWFLTAVGQVPMDRSGGRASATGLGPVMQTLADGGLVGIFPEGTRSSDGNLYKGRTGVARLALEAGVPVLPVGFVNTEFRKGLFGIPVMHRPGVIIGKPIDFGEFAGRADELKVLRHVTDQVMAGIQELTGQSYVDVYSTRVKYGDLAGGDLTEHVRVRPGGDRGRPDARA